MNLDNFHEFLKEPSNLHRVNYQELKSLVAAYPYSTNLRILLLLKSKLDKHPDLSRNLILAATYTSDRTLLHKIMHDPMLAVLADQHFEEEVLELMDLEKVEAIMSKEQPQEEIQAVFEKPLPETESNPSWASDIFEDSVIASGAGATVVTIDSLLNNTENEIEDLTEQQEEIAIYQKRIRDFSVDNFVGITTAIEKMDIPKKDAIEIVNAIEKPKYSFERKVTPLPKDSFASWLTQFEKDLNRDLDSPDINQTIEKVEATKIIKIVSEPEATPVLKKENLSAKKVAEKSLHLNTAIVSETLAELLVKQERYEKAISMYEKLGLKYPEKRHIFAAEIEKIKNL